MLMFDCGPNTRPTPTLPLALPPRMAKTLHTGWPLCSAARILLSLFRLHCSHTLVKFLLLLRPVTSKDNIDPVSTIRQQLGMAVGQCTPSNASKDNACCVNVPLSSDWKQSLKPFKLCRLTRQLPPHGGLSFHSDCRLSHIS